MFRLILKVGARCKVPPVAASFRQPAGMTQQLQLEQGTNGKPTPGSMNRRTLATPARRSAPYPYSADAPPQAVQPGPAVAHYGSTALPITNTDPTASVLP